jgi:hypothetical protein
MQPRDFAGENIPRIANRVRAVALSLLQLRVLGLGLRDVGVALTGTPDVDLRRPGAILNSASMVDYDLPEGRTDVTSPV